MTPDPTTADRLTMPLIFLDIDGVLNHFSAWEGVPGTSIYPTCIANLNWLLSRSDAKMVLSSSWRYMILGGAMTLLGFEYMLQSHGMRGALIGHTCDDAEHDMRGEQIRAWRRANKHSGPYVVLDDMNDGISDCGLNAVFTNCAVGLTRADAERALTFLIEKASDAA